MDTNDILADKKILIVDDEQDLAEISSLQFKSYGLTTETAPGGWKALEILKSCPVDIVLTDIRMAQGDGIELLKNIRDMNPTIPLVYMVTGFSKYSRDECIKIGANGFYSKPYDVGQIASDIARDLEKYADQQS